MVCSCKWRTLVYNHNKVQKLQLKVRLKKPYKTSSITCDNLPTRGRSPTFSLATFNNEWIFLLSKMASILWWTLSLLTRLAHIWCNKDRWWQHMQWWWLLKKRHDFMLNKHQMMIWFPLLLKHISVFILIWFIFYCLCTKHYRMSSMVFFSPLDAHFPLSTTCVHNLAACACNFSTSSTTWLGFLIFSIHHS